MRHLGPSNHIESSHLEVSDEVLLESWRGGDDRAGPRLVDRYYEKIARFVLYKTSAEHASDVVQAIFLAMVQGLGGYRGTSTVRAWLFGIARNKLLQHFAAIHNHHGRFDPDTSSVADLARTPSSVLELDHKKRRLVLAMSRLAFDDQLMLELHYWDQVPIAEIATIVGKPINTVKIRMRRSRKKLAEWLAE